MSLSRALVLKGGVIFAGCALAATIVIDRDPGETARLAEPTTRGKSPAGPKAQGAASAGSSKAAALDLSLLNRPPAAEPESNLFALPRPPAPPPPPPPVRSRAPEGPPPKPVAPPLPFRYVGTMVDGAVTTLFIAHGSQNYSVKPGDLIDGLYRLDELSASQATFVYLPLEQRQTLSIARPN